MASWLLAVRRALHIFFRGEDPVHRAIARRIRREEEMKLAQVKQSEEQVLAGMRAYLRELKRLDEGLDAADKRAAAVAKEVFEVAKKQLLIRDEFEKKRFQGLMESVKQDRFEDVDFRDFPTGAFGASSEQEREREREREKEQQQQQQQQQQATRSSSTDSDETRRFAETQL